MSSIALLLLFSVIVTTFITSNRVKDTGVLDVKSYVVNSYLYILLAILICSLTAVVVSDYMNTRISENDSSVGQFVWYMLGAFVVALISLFFVTSKNKNISHIAWLLIVVTIGIILYNPTLTTSAVISAVLTVIILMVGLTYFAGSLDDNALNSWGPYLMFALLGLIIFELFDIGLMFFSSNFNIKALMQREKMYSIITIVLFSAFVLYDTKKIYQHAKQAVSECGTNKCANYPAESLNLFLDIINLYVNISQRT